MQIRKFRGKSIYSGKWVYGFYLEQDAYNAGDKKKEILIHAGGLIVQNSKYDSATPVDKRTVGQSIGVKDKNGKEIYEGDIIEINSLNKKTQEKGLIEYSEQYLSYIITNTNSPIDEAENLSEYSQIEVIGNIYDNPELLEKGEE